MAGLLTAYINKGGLLTRLRASTKPSYLEDSLLLTQIVAGPPPLSSKNLLVLGAQALDPIVQG